MTGTRFIDNTFYGVVLVGTAPTYGRFANTLLVGAKPGLRVQREGNITSLHATFANPTPGTGAAIVILSGTVSITNSIITSHTMGMSLTAGTAWESHNLFFGNGADLAGPVTAAGGSQRGDPAFRNPAAGDYHLRSVSPAREMGVDAGVTVDIDGDPGHRRAASTSATTNSRSCC